MNFWGSLLLTAVAVLIVFSQQSNSTDVSIYIIGLNTMNNLGDGCQNGKNPVVNKNNSSASKLDIKREKLGDPKLVLKNGFNNCNYSLAVAEKKLLDGFSLDSKLLITRPTAAAQIIQKAKRDAENLILNAGDSVLRSLGEALSLSSDTAREGLAEASQMLQEVGLDSIFEIKKAITVADKEIRLKEYAAISAQKAIESGRHSIRNAFSALYHVIPIACQKAIRAVSDSQRRPMRMQIRNRNTDAAVKDSDALAAISAINRAAEDSINRGVPANKVNILRNSLIIALRELALLASNARDYFPFIVKLADMDKSLGKNVYLEEYEVDSKNLQEIIANIFLDFGSADIKSDGFGKLQLGKAIFAVELGNCEVFTRNVIGKQLKLLALGMQGSLRSLVSSAAEQSERCGQISLFEGIVNGAKLVFNAL